jgi:hypothetical protein
MTVTEDLELVAEMLDWVKGKWSQALPPEQEQEWVKKLQDRDPAIVEKVLDQMSSMSLFRPSAAEFSGAYAAEIRRQYGKNEACDCGGLGFVETDDPETLRPCQSCNRDFYDRWRKALAEEREQATGTLPPHRQITPKEQIAARVETIFRQVHERSQRLDTAVPRPQEEPEVLTAEQHAIRRVVRAWKASGAQREIDPQTGQTLRVIGGELVDAPGRPSQSAPSEARIDGDVGEDF